MSSLRLVTALAAVWLAACSQPTNQGYAPEQPVKFSHKVHAGDRQIACQYCHYAAERGKYAGIPATSLCLNCHKHARWNKPEVVKTVAALQAGRPIPWVRVHKLPDFVSFSHEPHVAAGVACQQCHGAVEKMEVVEQFAPLTMGWCVDCHRTGGKPTVEGQEPPPRVTGTHLMDCQTCHH